MERREKHKTKYERVKRILLETQGGVEHLFSKIKHVDVSGLQRKDDEEVDKEINPINVYHQRMSTILHFRTKWTRT